MPVVIGGDNLPSPVGIGLTDLPNIGGPSLLGEQLLSISCFEIVYFLKFGLIFVDSYSSELKSNQKTM